MTQQLEIAPIASTLRADDYEVVVIGAGQAGLAMGYYLQQQGRRFTIVDASDAVGAVWRDRWDSLRLFTPAKYSSLPGYAFPAEPYHLPHKDEVAAYFRDYAERFALPVRLNTRVNAVHRDAASDRYTIETSTGVLHADHVVVATGAFQTPYVPAFARDLRPDIQQMHSSAYRRPAQLRGARALVVGAGSSGAQIAIDLTKTHQVFLSGRDPGNAPRTLLGADIYDWYYGTGIMCIRRDTFLGRQAGTMLEGGDARVGVSRKMIEDSGALWLPRIEGVRDGLPVTAEGDAIDIDAVIWSTGFRANFSWIAGLPTDARGYPRHTRGVVDALPRVYFVGLQFLYRINSHLMGGVGADAEYIASLIAERSGIER